MISIFVIDKSICLKFSQKISSFGLTYTLKAVLRTVTKVSHTYLKTHTITKNALSGATTVVIVATAILVGLQTTFNLQET
jgi:hypothetical protein